MNKERLILFLMCLFVICVFSVIASACPCPPCPPCYHRTSGYPSCGCGWNCGSGQTCCKGSCCSGYCCNSCCSGSGTCCNNSCCSTGYCCDGKKCYNPNTENCCGNGTGKTCPNGKNCCGSNCCDPCNCESCMDGSCKVCGNDPNQKCCGGACCNKVWTTHTTEAINTFCPSCGNGPPGEGLCGGTTTEIESYEHCVIAEAGQGEHCQCNSEMQVVGYTYPCMINWDLGRMAWCALRGAWCLEVCYYTMDPVKCANCLAGAGTDCCPGECDVCDFIETCEKNPYYPDPQESLVFTNFGC